MKRMFVFLLVSLLLSCLCCIGFAAAPPQSRITAEIFYSFDDKDDAPFTIDNGNNGWFFYEAPETRYSRPSLPHSTSTSRAAFSHIR